MADELGYFKANGLNVNIIQPPEDSSIALVGCGKAQFCISFQDSLSKALTSNTPVPVTAVATILKHNTYGILSKKETGIISAKDLENKTYSTWNTPIEIAMLKHIIETDGGDFSRINIIPNCALDAAAALTSGIDAVNVYYSWDGVATNVKKIETNFLKFSDIDKTLDFYAPIIVADDKYLQEKPEIVKRFLAALEDGYIYSIENPISASEILIKRNPELSREMVIKSQAWLSTQYKADNEYWGMIEETKWNAFFDWLYNKNLISKSIVGKGFTNQYLKSYENIE